MWHPLTPFMDSNVIHTNATHLQSENQIGQPFNIINFDNLDFLYKYETIWKLFSLNQYHAMKIILWKIIF